MESYFSNRWQDLKPKSFGLKLQLRLLKGQKKSSKQNAGNFNERYIDFFFQIDDFTNFFSNYFIFFLQNREATARIEELETANKHLETRLGKLKTAKSNLLKDL